MVNVSNGLYLLIPFIYTSPLIDLIELKNIWPKPFIRFELARHTEIKCTRLIEYKSGKQESDAFVVVVDDVVVDKFGGCYPI